MEAGIINPNIAKILKEQERREKLRLKKEIKELEAEKGKMPKIWNILSQ